jgi:hypothetical protein
MEASITGRSVLFLDPETGAIFQQRNFYRSEILDVMGDVGFFRDFTDERFHFIFVTHDLELDRTVGQILDPPPDFKATGEILDRIAESDALDAAVKDDLFGNH